MLNSLLLAMIALAAECPLPSPEILKAEKAGYTAIWRLESSPALQGPLREGELKAYERWVKANTHLSAKGLIENNIEVGRRLKRNLRPNDPFRAAIERNEYNGRLIFTGVLGRIRPISCLESLPFRQLLALVDLRTKPVEFFATILTRGGEIALIADFYPNDYSGAHESRAARRARARLRKNGWGREVSFHNHPFNFANEYGDLGGALAPSEADIEMYRSARPAEARITNGIDTVLFSDYSRFHP